MHNVHKLCKKEQKMRFLAILLRLVNQIHLISQMMIEKNIFNDLVKVRHQPELINYAQIA